MEAIEAVRVKTTLKAGGNKWRKGSTIFKTTKKPIPQDLLMEVRLKTGTVEVLRRETTPPTPPSSSSPEPVKKEKQPSEETPSEKTKKETKKKSEGRKPKLIKRN